MTDLRPMERELSILRWGGLAGIVGAVLFLFVFVFVGAFIGADPAGPAAPIERFPEIRAARTVENGLYLAVLVLWVPSYLALYRALSATSPASALFGSALGIVGLAVLAAGAVPHAATVPLADAYTAATTAAGRDALVVAWHTTQGIFNALLITGLGIMPPSLVLLGFAMRGSPALGMRYGVIAIVLGAATGGTFVVTLVDPQSLIAVISVFALIVFHMVMGIRLVSLSRKAAVRGLAVAQAGTT